MIPFDVNTDRFYSAYSYELNKLTEKLNLIIDSNEPVLIRVDSDIDGLNSFKIVSKFLTKLGVPHKQYAERYKLHGFTNDFMEYIYNNDYNVIIVPDAGTNDENQIRKLLEDGYEVIILDHHIRTIDRIRELNFTYINSTEHETEWSKTSGAMLCYLVMSRVYKTLAEHTLSPRVDDLLELAMISIVTDICDLTDKTNYETVAFYNEGRYCRSEIIRCFESFKMKCSTKFINSVLAPALNNCIRLGYMPELAEAFMHEDYSYIKTITQVSKSYHSALLKLQKTALSNSSIVEYDNFVVVFNNDEFFTVNETTYFTKNFASNIAARISQQFDKTVMSISIAQGTIYYSVRTNELEALTIFNECGLQADGHRPAFGGIIVDTASLPNIIAKIDARLGEVSSNIDEASAESDLSTIKQLAEIYADSRLLNDIAKKNSVLGKYSKHLNYYELSVKDTQVVQRTYCFNYIWNSELISPLDYGDILKARNLHVFPFFENNTVVLKARTFDASI